MFRIRLSRPQNSSVLKCPEISTGKSTGRTDGYLGLQQDYTPSSPVRLRGRGCLGGSHITFFTVNLNGVCLCSTEHRPPCNQFLLSALGWLLEIYPCWLLIRIRWLCFVCSCLHCCRVQSEADLFWVTLLDSDEARKMILFFLSERLLSVLS